MISRWAKVCKFLTFFVEILFQSGPSLVAGSLVPSRLGKHVKLLVLRMISLLPCYFGVPSIGEGKKKESMYTLFVYVTVNLIN